MLAAKDILEERIKQKEEQLARMRELPSVNPIMRREGIKEIVGDAEEYIEHEIVFLRNLHILL